MNTFGISEQSYFLIERTLKSYSEIEGVIIFGSRAKGNFRKGSDIDLALKGVQINEELIISISAILNERLNIPYKIDVLAYQLIENTDLKDHIDRVGLDFLAI